MKARRVTPRRPRRSELLAFALVLAALALAACGGGDEDSGDAVTAANDRPVAEETAADRGRAQDEEEPAEAGPVPSDYARRAIDRKLLALYIRTGEDLALEWWVIAAVDQIDLNAGDPNIPPRERVPGIGYSLAAAGAPYDNHAALSARAGGAYADRALKLAGRYVDTVAEQGEDNGDDSSAGDEAADDDEPAADSG